MFHASDEIPNRPSFLKLLAQKALSPQSEVGRYVFAIRIADIELILDQPEVVYPTPSQTGENLPFVDFNPSLNTHDQFLNPETAPEIDMSTDLADVPGMTSISSPETVTISLVAEGEPEYAPIVEGSTPLINFDASPAEIPDALVPGHHHAPAIIDDSIPFTATHPESNSPAEIPLTLAPDQPSPPQVVHDVPAPDVETNLSPGTDEPLLSPNDDDDAAPLPVIVTDGFADDDVGNSTAITDTPIDVPRTRSALMAEARALMGKASTAEREKDRFEAERKRANEEGRRKYSILLAGDRDEMAAMAAKYRKRAARYFYHGTLHYHFHDPVLTDTFTPSFRRSRQHQSTIRCH
jgi:hypothetical protein